MGEFSLGKLSVGELYAGQIVRWVKYPLAEFSLGNRQWVICPVTLLPLSISSTQTIIFSLQNIIVYSK